MVLILGLGFLFLFSRKCVRISWKSIHFLELIESLNGFRLDFLGFQTLMGERSGRSITLMNLRNLYIVRLLFLHIYVYHVLRLGPFVRDFFLLLAENSVSLIIIRPLILSSRDLVSYNQLLHKSITV